MFHFTSFKYVFLFILTLVTLALSKIKVQEHTLDNGLKILLYPSEATSTVSCRLFFKTGSIHESPGKTGIAHMLEHMLFKGSKKVGITDSILDKKYIQSIDSLLAKKTENLSKKEKKALQKKYFSLLKKHREIFISEELWNAYLKEGGSSLNASTGALMTSYYVTLPKNKVELFLWLESDRMQNAVLREFYPERDVVMEERRMRYEDSPYGRYFEMLNSMFYEAHPYRLPTIGYQSDIKNLTRQQAQEHYEKYYKPNNAILILVGNFKAKTILKKIKKYFASIPKGKEHTPIVTRDPEPIGQKTFTLKKDGVQPRMDILFKTPGFPHEDTYPLLALEGILSGKSGRLYKTLVLTKNVANEVDVRKTISPHHSSFSIGITLSDNININKIKRNLKNIIKDLKRKKVSKEELGKVKNQIKLYSLQQLKNQDYLATILGYYQLWGDWNYINTITKKMNKVTTKDIQRVVKKYLNLDYSTIGILLPKN